MKIHLPDVLRKVDNRVSADELAQVEKILVQLDGDRALKVAGFAPSPASRVAEQIAKAGLNMADVISEKTVKTVMRRYSLALGYPSEYRGGLDPKVGQAVADFNAKMEKVASIQRERFVLIGDRSLFAEVIPSNRDPVLLYCLGAGYFYLICQWGGDLSVWRRLRSLAWTSIASLMSAVGLSLIIDSLRHPSNEIYIGVFLVGFLVSALSAIMWAAYSRRREKITNAFDTFHHRIKMTA